MQLEEAKDILKNIICDDVIGTYCIEIQKQGVKCDNNCKNNDCIYIQAIETVLQELERLKQDNYRLDRENQLMFESKIYSIPKKKIEDMIEAYKKLIDDISESEHYSHEIPLYRHDIQVLQQLLEE